MKSSRTSSLLTNDVTRRDLMRLLGVGVAAGALGVSGARVLAQEASPVVGDRPEITIGVQALPATFDPAVDYSNVSLRTFYSIYDYLVEYDYLGGDTPGMGSELIPSLVTAWTEIDELTTEFTLRDDVTFHDGSKLTANDVKYTVDRVIGPDADATLTSFTTSLFPGFASVEVIDDVTFRIITTAPKQGLVNTFAYGQFWVLPQAYLEEVGNEEFGRNPIGTGPYRFVEFVADDRLILDAYDGYWGSPAAFSKVTFRVIPEDATRIAALQSKELNIITNVPPDQMLQLANDSSLVTSSLPLANAHIYMFNTNHPNVANKLVRQGLNRGFDRKAIISTLWQGMADYMGSFQIPSWGDFYNPDRDAYAFDVDAAKALLEEGGYNGEEIVYSTLNGYYVLGVEVAQVIVASWQALGVNARVEVVDQWAPDETTMMITWSNDLLPNEPSHTFWRIWGADGIAQLYGFWTPQDARYNGEFGETLLTSSDQAARVAAYQSILDIWDDEAPAGILYNQHATYVEQAGTGWQPYTIYGMDLR